MSEHPHTIRGDEDHEPLFVDDDHQVGVVSDAAHRPAQYPTLAHHRQEDWDVEGEGDEEVCYRQITCYDPTHSILGELRYMSLSTERTAMVVRCCWILGLIYENSTLSRRVNFLSKFTLQL